MKAITSSMMEGLPHIGLNWQLRSDTGWGVYGMAMVRYLLEKRLAVATPLGWHELHGDDEKDFREYLTWCKLHGAAGIQTVINPGGNDLPNGLPKTDNRLIHCFEWTSGTGMRKANLDRYSRIIALSSWNKEVLRAQGYDVACAPVGVDCELFHPIEGKVRDRETFVIYSGGKMEYRKGQDLVLKAFKIFQQRHPLAILVTNWLNHWPETVDTRLFDNGEGSYVPNRLAAAGVLSKIYDPADWAFNGHGIPEDSFVNSMMIPREQLAIFLRDVDCAVFPNRCEGATNQVAMECLASGVPTILSDNSGHKDLIGVVGNFCYPLVNQMPVLGTGMEYWGESQVEEIVERLEEVYSNREAARLNGQEAALRMKQYFSWDYALDFQFKSLDITNLPNATESIGVFGADIAEEEKPDPVVRANTLAKHAGNLRDAGLYEAALAVARRAYALAPNSGWVKGQLGAVLLSAGRLREAKKMTEEALESPDAGAEAKAGLHHNLGLIYFYLADFNTAIKHYEIAKTAYPEAVWDTAHALLIQGKFKEGWAHIEARRFMKSWGFKPDVPEWDGKPFGGMLWVSTEQGTGDIIQFSRYLPWARSRCEHLVLYAHPHIAPLFYGFPGVDTVIPAEEGVPIPDADFHSGLMSLARLYETDLKNLPQDPGWFKQVALRMPGELESPPELLKVGIVWAGNPKHLRDAERTMKLEQFLPIASLPEVAVFSFQVGSKARDIDRLGAGAIVSDLSEHLTSWIRTAGALTKLDLLITVDTGVAHLAGALGVPTWILIPKVADWRWLRDRRDSPWYPSVRLFRQERTGEWDDVIAKVIGELKKFKK